MKGNTTAYLGIRGCQFIHTSGNGQLSSQPTQIARWLGGDEWAWAWGPGQRSPALGTKSHLAEESPGGPGEAGAADTLGQGGGAQKRKVTTASRAHFNT